MFWARRAEPAQRPPARDPFAAVPLRPENLEVRYDSAGHAHLRVQPALKGLRKRLATLLRHDYSRKVQLDAYGTLFIDMVDGRNRLRDIADHMVAGSGKDRKAVEEGVILFTRKLMTMNMIHLRIEGRPAASPAAPARTE